MKLLIVDDDPLICKSLTLMLSREVDLEVLGAVQNGEEALAFCQENPPDLVLMDIRMPKMDGIQATRLIKKRFPRIRVLMLTTFQDKPYIQQALKAGAEGYLLKTDGIAGLGNKLRMVYSGAAVLDGEVLKTLTTPQLSALSRLTAREKEVLALVTQGLSNKEIAAELFLSEGTVRNVISVIMDKLEVKNRTELTSLVLGG